jgi:hypothetical protein
MALAAMLVDQWCPNYNSRLVESVIHSLCISAAVLLFLKIGP